MPWRHVIELSAESILESTCDNRVRCPDEQSKRVREGLSGDSELDQRRCIGIEDFSERLTLSEEPAF
jgi:hypothetical protein